MLKRDIVVFDLETGGRNPFTCQPTQIAAVALDGRNLKPKGEFCSGIWAETDDDKAIEAGLAPIEEGALKVTGQTREEIAKFPTPESVWRKFVSFVNRFNYKKTSWFAPIGAGWNTLGYDMPIINRMAEKYGQWDDKRNQQTLFHQIFHVDMMQNMYMWMEADQDVKSLSLDTMRERFGIPKEGAHDALKDVKDTADILAKFLKTHRAVYRNLELDQCLAGKSMFE